MGAVEEENSQHRQSASRPRLAIVVSHPIQHFCPMYRAITADGRVDLLVVFAVMGAQPLFDRGFGRVVEWQKNLVDDFAHVVVRGVARERTKGVIQQLSEFSPDVVYVHGYSEGYLRAAMHWAHRRRIPVLMTTDSELLHARPWYIRAVKRLTLPFVLRKVDLFLTVGDENERYFAHYGVSNRRFHRVPFSIDSAYYDGILADGEHARRELRRKLDISDETVAILTVGKMLPHKAQADLVRAVAGAVQSARHPVVLLVAGDGAERERLEQLAKPLGQAVRLLGFIGVDELPRYYLAADLYVHPSHHDPHPLAVSEALYCSLPVVASDRIGSIGASDDVQAKRNGWVYPSGDVPALTAILSRLIDDPALRKRAGAESRKLGMVHDAAHCGRLFVDGALLALSRRGYVPGAGQSHLNS